MQYHNLNNAHIFSVKELNLQIKSLLEHKFPFVWVTGEISNFKAPYSGHYYFVLKDAFSQIPGVMFRGQNQHLKFALKEGMSITGLGRITVYEPRGNYQIIFEHMEPKGIGALYLAFEQLKQKLQSEGLFDTKHKKELPFLPQKIAIITSPTGAAIQDMFKVIRRRFRNIEIKILPTKVQGKEAETEIISALDMIPNLKPELQPDIIILARGGGSFEDLNVFNSEKIARTLFNLKIPVITAVGHETDFTLVDFVADLRAPTPSAAAELVVPEKDALAFNILELRRNLFLNIHGMMKTYHQKITYLNDRLIDPQKRVDDYKIRIDDLTHRIHTQLMYHYSRKNDVLVNAQDRLKNIRHLIQKNKSRYEIAFRRLLALSPKAVLKRGYSITRKISNKSVVTDASRTKQNDVLEIILSKGKLKVQVQEKEENG